MAIAEPIWSLERRDSGHLFWRRDASKVKFRYEVEVLEYEKDPEEHYINDPDQHRPKHIFVAATCIAALAVTMILPWILIGSS